MHRKSIALIAILAAILLSLNFQFILGSITGFVTLTEQLTINLSVSNSTEGKIIYFLYPSYVVEDNPASFIVNFKNIGNQNFTGRIEIHIYDSANNAVESFYDDNFTLAPLEIDSFFTTWTPDELGTYYASARVPYDNKTAEENRTFEVISSAPPTTLPPVSHPGYYLGPTPVIPVINLTLDYPEIVNLTQGESSLIDIDAFNLGNVDLHNLSLSAISEEFILDIHPTEVSILKAQSSTTFLMSVQIPVDTEINEYPINFSVSSEEITETGEITINVMLLEVCMEVEQSIENYDYLLDKMLVELQKAMAEDRNVTIAMDYLDKAKKEFDLAKELFGSDNCEAAKIRLENVKMYLEKTIVELARAIRLPKPSLIVFLNVGLIILILLLLLLAYIKRKKKKKKKRKKKRKFWEKMKRKFKR